MVQCSQAVFPQRHIAWCGVDFEGAWEEVHGWCSVFKQLFPKGILHGVVWISRGLGRRYMDGAVSSSSFPPRKTQSNISLGMLAVPCNRL